MTDNQLIEIITLCQSNALKPDGKIGEELLEDVRQLLAGTAPNQAQYWKERCEAAEKLIENVAIHLTDENVKYHTDWHKIFRTEPPAPAQGVEKADEERQGFIAMAEYRNSFPENYQPERFNGFYDGFIAGSRWQQGQGNVKCQYCGQMYHGEEPKSCCSGRDCGCMGLPVNGPFVCSKGCYEKLMEGNKPPQPPTCGARWVRASVWISRSEQLPNEDEKVLVLYGDKNILIGIMDSDNKFSLFWRDGLGKEDFDRPITHWMPLPSNESPCTFPTRQEAKHWAKNNVYYTNAALAMYDWIFNPQKDKDEKSKNH